MTERWGTGKPEWTVTVGDDERPQIRDGKPYLFGRDFYIRERYSAGDFNYSTCGMGWIQRLARRLRRR